MKKLIALLTFVTATSAHAFQAMPDTVAPGSFDSAYSLTQFNINAKSYAIPFGTTVTAGDVSLNMKTNELRLTLYRHITCPKGAMCAMMVPAPVQVTLPIVHMGPGICGGTIIVAERDLRPVDGGMTSIEIIDDNGNFCEPKTTTLKPVNVTVTEVFARTNTPIVSTMTGIPVQ